jgi:hypothetical protein
MKQFGLTTWEPAKCKHVAKREEQYGDELVDAMTIHYRIEFTNDRLDDWFPGLRAAIYMAKDSQTIPGVPETTPEKRTDLIESPHHLKTECAGYMLYMRRGAGHSNPMQVEWAGADAKDFKLDAKAGGICTLEFKVNVSGLDPETMGRLASMGGREVEIMFVPPKLQEGTMPDGHQPPKSKAKAVSPKQLKLAGGTDTQPPGDSAADAGGVNPFKYSVRDGQVVDNSPALGQQPGTGEPPSATELFLDVHAPTGDELPDDGSGDSDPDDHYEDIDAAAGATGLADDIMPLPRSVAKKVAITTKPRKKV